MSADTTAEQIRLAVEALKGTPGEGVPYLDDAVSVLAKAWRADHQKLGTTDEALTAARRLQAQAEDRASTSYREGYEAALKRLGEEAQRDAMRASGLSVASNHLDEVLERAAEVAEGPSCARGAKECGHEHCADIEAAAADIRAMKPTTAAPLKSPDYHELTEMVFGAVGLALREKQRADEATERALGAESRSYELSALRTAADLRYGVALVGKQEAERRTDDERVQANEWLTQLRDARAEVQSLTSRLEQMRGRAEEADLMVAALKIEVGTQQRRAEEAEQFRRGR